MQSDTAINEDNLKPWYPRVIVLGPGGVKGLQILGFLSPLEDAGLFKYTDIYCGVSVGALISLLLVAGYEIREIVGEAAKLDLFKDIESFAFNSIINNRGLISNEPIKKRLTELIVNKFGTVPNLQNLYLQTGKSLITGTLNATDEICVMMGPSTHPNISCIDATMFSMNIPFVFYQLIYQGKVYVDGALGNPYPVDYFDDGNTNILGVYLKTDHNTTTQRTLTVNNQIIQRIEEQPETLPFSTYTFKIIQSLMDQRRNHIIQQSSQKCKHVCLKTTTKDTTGYSVSIEEKGHMLVNGFNAGKDFLYELCNNSYVGPNVPDVLRFEYPQYYLGENTSDNDNENIDILDAMNQ